LQTPSEAKRTIAHGFQGGRSRTVTDMPRNEASAEIEKDTFMTNVVSCPPAITPERSRSANPRAQALADRLEAGARALAALANALTDAQWHTRVLKDGRKVGVVVHHVASVYPLEIQLAQTVAAGHPVTEVTMDHVHAMNAAHAKESDAVTRDAAIDLLRHNAAAAAAAVRALDDEALDRAAAASLYSNAPVTCQFMLEDHAVRHSYHHLASIERTLNP
jgi:hypothetical protein